MAWYAELRRRRWYCINQFDAISWYSNHLYEEWWNSLTDEQRERIEERRRLRKEQKSKEAQAAIMRLMSMTCAVAGLNHRSSNEEKYHGVYDEYGFPKL